MAAEGQQDREWPDRQPLEPLQYLGPEPAGVDQSDNAAGEDLVDAVPGDDADMLSSDDPRDRHCESKDRHEIEPAPAEDQTDEGDADVELHLDAERPEMRAAVEQRDRRGVCNEQEVPPDRNRVIVVPQHKEGHSGPAERDDTREPPGEKI